MQVRLRAATGEDAPAIVQLWQDAEAVPTHADDVESMLRLIAHDAGALIVADDDGAIVGSVIAGWDGWRGSIYRLAVVPGHRGKGLARLLLAEAESRLAEVGARRMSAIVIETDQRAVGFWQRTGWEQQSERLRFVKG